MTFGWAVGRGPDPSLAAMVFWCCDTVLSPQLCRTKASCKRTQASGELPAARGGRQVGSWQGRKAGKSQGLELVSCRFRKSRLAVWAAGRGPDPSFTAMVFWCCDTVLSPQLCRTKASCKRTQASGELAVQKGRQKSRFGASFYDPSFTAMVFWCCDTVLSPQLCRTQASCKRTQASGRQVGSWQCRKAGKSQGLGLVSRQFRQQHLALGAAGSGPDPSFTAMVFWCCDTVLSLQLCRTQASCKRTQASGELAVQKGRQKSRFGASF